MPQRKRQKREMRPEGAMSSEQESSNVTKLSPGKDGSEGGRRIHLRDITAETSLDGDSVGVTLRKVRLKSGEDLKSVSDKLRIRRAYLEALEESRHEDLPGRPYAIGFVRTYASYLGLNAADLVARYKSETQPPEEEAAREEFSFPEVREDARLPKGSLLILAVLLGAGIYGAWLLSISADRMVTERVPPVPERLGSVEGVASAETSVPAPTLSRPGKMELTGDSAAAANNDGALPSANAPVRSAPLPSAEAEVAPVAEGAMPGEPVADSPGDPVEVAALTPSEPAPDSGASVTIADDLALAVGGARVYGLENENSRVIVRAAKQAWLRIEAGDGSVLLNQTLEPGEVYRAPLGAEAILVARDAGAFELFVDGRLIGAAGPAGLVLTGKSLRPDDLLRR